MIRYCTVGLLEIFAKISHLLIWILSWWKRWEWTNFTLHLIIWSNILIRAAWRTVSSPTCSRYPCWDTWTQMPETWGHCRHSCSKLSATNQPKPSRLLLSSNHLAGSQTYLQTCYCMCWVPYKAALNCTFPYEQGGTAVFHCWKTWISRVLAPNAVLTSAVREAVNPAVVQKPHSNMALIYVYGGSEEEDYLWRSLLFFLCTPITMWIEFSCSSDVPQILFLNNQTAWVSGAS